MGKAKARKRQPNDSYFFVELVDKHSERRCALGNFWGASQSEAIDQARASYPGLFASMETNTWAVQAKETAPPRPVARPDLFSG